MIDPRAIVDPTARIGRDVHVGPWTIIGADVEIGDECWIASHVIVKGPTRIGRGNRVYQFSSVGESTPALVYKGEPTTLAIGDGNTLREGVTVHRGTVQDRGCTSIGDHNLLMAYVHVGHDCVVGSHVIMSNNAGLGGHVVVGDHANLGGYAAIPQYRTVGTHAMVGGMSLVLKDVPAFVSVSGNPAGAVGCNVEGMRRRPFTPEEINAVREAYRVLYRKGLNVDVAVQELVPLAAQFPAVQSMLEGVRNSKFGIIRPRMVDAG